MCNDSSVPLSNVILQNWQVYDTKPACLPSFFFFSDIPSIGNDEILPYWTLAIALIVNTIELNYYS